MRCHDWLHIPRAAVADLQVLSNKIFLVLFVIFKILVDESEELLRNICQYAFRLMEG